MGTKVHRRKGGPKLLIPLLSDIQPTQSMETHTHPKENDYQNEEAIWRIKASEKNYTLKRPPALQEYYLTMSKEDRRDFRANCRLMLHAICRKLRAETMSALNDMEATQLFNAEANAHRAQNLYLNRLYQSISCDALEDKVLFAMKDHHQHAQIKQSRRLSESTANDKDLKKTEEEHTKTVESAHSSRFNLPRKPGLPTFEEFLSSGVSVNTTRRNQDPLFTHFRSFERSHQNFKQEETQLMTTKSLSALRNTPAGRALQKSTSKVVFKILKEQEASAQSNSRRIGMSLLEQTGSKRKGRGYYTGFRHLFDSRLDLEDGSNEMKSNENNLGISEGEEVKGSPMKGQLAEDAQEPIAATPASKQGTRRRSIFRMSLKQTNDVKDSQARLVLIWEVLRVPTVGRLAFMQKYSSSLYATLFAVAVDLWNAVALIVIMRLTVFKMK